MARKDVQSPGSLWYEHVYDPDVFELHPGGKPLPIVLNPATQFPTNPPGPTMRQIGTEGGFLVRDVRLNSPKSFNPHALTGNLLLGPAERADVIIDFSKLEGQEIIMYNDAPGPFPNGGPETDFYLGNPLNPIQPLPGTGPDTRQILRIRVIPARTADPQPPQPILDPMLVDPPLLVALPFELDPVPPLSPPPGAYVRDLTLNEDFDEYGRLTQLLGTLAGGLEYHEPATEVVPAGATEVWRIFNLSEDTHPIHFHLVNVQVLSRQPFEVGDGGIELTDLPLGSHLSVSVPCGNAAPSRADRPVAPPAGRRATMFHHSRTSPHFHPPPHQARTMAVPRRAL